MEKFLNYQILPYNRLIVEYFRGDIRGEDIIALKELELKDPGYNPFYNLIDDFREARIIATENDVSDFADYMKSNAKLHGKRNSAYITRTPGQVVATTLFDILKDDLPINIKIVSSVEAAADWVGLTISAGDLEKVLATLRYSVKSMI